MTASLLRPPGWTRSAACTGLATRSRDPFHPSEELTPRARAAEYAFARVVCAGCPVRHPCALEALHGAIAHGMYGGLTPSDRIVIARRFGYPRPGAAQHGSRSKYVTGCTDGPDGGACADCLRAHREWMQSRRVVWGGSKPPGAVGAELEVDEAAALPLAVGGMR